MKKMNKYESMNQCVWWYRINYQSICINRQVGSGIRKKIRNLQWFM